MRLIYEGVDITGSVEAESCRVTERMGGADDLIDITLWNQAAWNRWKPQPDDRIRIDGESGYSSGTMYVMCVVPEDGKYRMLATGLPGAARRKTWAAYRNRTMNELLKLAAAECRMGSAIWGLNGENRYPYLTRRDEGAGAFLARLAAREGAILKCAEGKMNLISLRWAAARPAAASLTIQAGQEGVRREAFPAERIKSLTVISPLASAEAEEAEATYGRTETRADGEALTAAIAGRWARGTMTTENLAAERLTVDGAFMPGMTAAARVDVTGGTGADGKWMVYEAAHDLINLSSRVVMVRAPEGDE